MPEERFPHIMRPGVPVENPDEPAPELMIPISERRETILAALSPEDRAYHAQLEIEIAPLEAMINSLPQVQALHMRRQLGGKSHPDDLPQEHESLVIHTPPYHTRFEHTQLLAELIKAVAAHLHLSPAEAKTAVAAAWLHDIGHAAFSHIGDDILVEHGLGNHEERSIKMVRGMLKSHLEKFGIDSGDVENVIREKGALGSLQSAIDTLSYLILDVESVDPELSEVDCKEYIDDILDIDREKGMLVLASPQHWQEVLEIRAIMMHGHYYHPINRRTEEARRQLLRISLKKGVIDLQTLSEDSDEEIRARLQSNIFHDPLTARLGGRTDATANLKEYSDLWSMFAGAPAENWDRLVYDTRAEAESALYRRPAAAIEQSFIVAPHDYTKKTVPVIVRDATGDHEVVLKARDTKLRPEDSKYILYSPKG